MIDTRTTRSLEEKISTLESLIGNTPLFEIQNVFQKPGVKIYAKLEWQQLSGSVKARAAFQIIKQAIKTQQLTEDVTLIDASSGNTAIAYAALGAALGIRVKIFLPKNASTERKRLLAAYGAEVQFTSPFGSTDEAQDEAKKAFQENPHRYFYADQYNNENNWRAHYLTTGNEIFSQTLGTLTHFVCGVGTSGTFTGTARRLQERNPEIKLISLHPDTALHGLEGWKDLQTAKIPGIYDADLAHQTISIESSEAIDLIKEVARKEGLLLSPSSAANLAGAIKVAHQLEEGVVVTVFPDSAERYSEIISELFNS
ncbi:MAG TPA: PLP-dependent cysteine synthase family protein [Cyclobacteriaceae bacterium]|nr:PLP-dependent cysteine synthase family protein [Cyclobacteriaceae bacterium]